MVTCDKTFFSRLHFKESSDKDKILSAPRTPSTGLDFRGCSSISGTHKNTLRGARNGDNYRKGNGRCFDISVCCYYSRPRVSFQSPVQRASGNAWKRLSRLHFVIQPSSKPISSGAGWPSRLQIASLQVCIFQAWTSWRQPRVCQEIVQLGFALAQTTTAAGAKRMMKQHRFMNRHANICFVLDALSVPESESLQTGARCCANDVWKIQISPSPLGNYKKTEVKPPPKKEVLKAIWLLFRALWLCHTTDNNYFHINIKHSLA